MGFPLLILIGIKTGYCHCHPPKSDDLVPVQYIDPAEILDVIGTFSQ